MKKPANQSEEILSNDAIENTDDKHDPGMLSGMAAGAAAGALAGSALGPLGAVTGATIGGTAGAIAGLAIAKNVDPSEETDVQKADVDNTKPPLDE